MGWPPLLDLRVPLNNWPSEILTLNALFFPDTFFLFFAHTLAPKLMQNSFFLLLFCVIFCPFIGFSPPWDRRRRNSSTLTRGHLPRNRFSPLLLTGE